MRLLLLLFVFTSFELLSQPPIYNIKNLEMNTEDNFGTSVAVSNEYIAVGCNGTENQTGSLSIYRGSAGSWSLISNQVHSAGMEGDFMGNDVAMTEKHIIIGAPTDHWVDNQTGRVFIYALENDEWTEQAILQPSQDFEKSAYGFIVNIHEDYAIIGAPDYQDTGGVVLYQRNGSEWIQQEIFHREGYTFNSFGGAIDVSDEWIAIGAYEQDFENGTGNRQVVFLYQREGNSWIEKQMIGFEFENQLYQIPWHGLEFSEDQLLVTNHRSGADTNIDGLPRVYNLEEGVWVEDQIFTHPDFAIHEIGRHAAHSDKWAIIGASHSFNSGFDRPHHLLLYSKADKYNWEVIGDYSFEGSSSTNWQGYNLDINDNYAVASSHHHSNQHGDVYVIDLRRFVNNQNLLTEQEINLFPIPTNNELTIQSKEAAISSFYIFSPQGQVIQTQSNLATKELKINIDQFPAGNYWIKVNTEDGYMYKQISKID